MTAVAISFINGKGGVAKTSSAVSVAGYFASQGNKVLLMDCDPQGNSSFTFNRSKPDRDFKDLIIDEIPFSDVVVKVEDNLDLLPMYSHKHDTYLEVVMSTRPNNSELILVAIENHLEDYDYIVFDGPPSLGLIASNILRASDICVVPMDPEEYAAEGAQAILRTIKRSMRENPELKFGGFLFTKYNDKEKNNLKKDVYNQMKQLQFEVNQELKVFKVTIRKRKELGEALRDRTHIFNLPGKLDIKDDYASACKEILNNL